MKMITPEEFAKRMQDIINDERIKDDQEIRHYCMDNLMVETLESLSYEEGLKIFENTPKWYA